MAWVTIVAMLALIEYFFFSIKVGQARAKYGVKAPATTGNEHFERYHRVHQNTLEQLVIFLPGLYGFATFVSPMWAAILGVVFIVGRAVYYNLYIGNPDKRGPGVIVSVLANAVLVVGSIVGALMTLG
jgi:glutathione S-transferase